MENAVLFVSGCILNVEFPFKRNTSACNTLATQTRILLFNEDTNLAC